MRISLRQLSPQLKTAVSPLAVSDRAARNMRPTDRQGKNSQGVSGEAHQIMMQTSGVFPDVETVSSKPHMTTRSLRRKLRDEGTSFVATTDDVRCLLVMNTSERPEYRYHRAPARVFRTDKLSARFQALDRENYSRLSP